MDTDLRTYPTSSTGH